MSADFDLGKLKKSIDDTNRTLSERLKDVLKDVTETAQKAVKAYEDYERKHKATIEALQDEKKLYAFLKEITFDDIRSVVLVEGEDIPEEYTKRIRDAFTGDDQEARREVFESDFSIFEAVPIYEAYYEKISRAGFIIDKKTGQLSFNIEQLNRPHKPKITVLNNTKVYKQIIDLATVPGKYEVLVSPSKAKQRVTAIVDISQLKNIEIYGGNLTKIDLLNLKAVHDLYEAGNEYITADMVYRARKGYVSTQKVRKSSTEQTRLSLQKMSNIKITIDYAEHIKMNYPGIDTSRDKFKRTRALLPMDEIQIMAGGVEVWAFRLLKPVSKKEEDPILLYQYASDVKQLIRLPFELLDVKDTINRSTDYDDILKNYLLEQISWIKQPGSRRSNQIAYAGIYAEIYGEKEISRKQKHTTRAKTRDILYSFKCKGFIKDYQEYPEGKKEVTGVNIVI